MLDECVRERMRKIKWSYLNLRGIIKLRIILIGSRGRFVVILRCLEWLKRDILNIRWGTWLWFRGNLDIWLFGRRHFQAIRIAGATLIRTTIDCASCGCCCCCAIGSDRCGWSISWTTIVIVVAITIIVIILWHILSGDIHWIAQSLMLLEQIFQFIHTRFQVLLQSNEKKRRKDILENEIEKQIAK